VALLNHRVIMLNMGVPPDNSLSKKGVAGMLKDGWDELDRKVDIELAVPPVLRRTRNIFIVLFALGQFLPLSAPTYSFATSPQPSPS
jgi:hypothetical protein